MQVVENGFGFPPKQMVGILMTHQHGPLDFDPTATNRRVPLNNNCSRWIEIQRPMLVGHEDPYHLLRRESKSVENGPDVKLITSTIFFKGWWAQDYCGHSVPPPLKREFGSLRHPSFELILKIEIKV